MLYCLLVFAGQVKAQEPGIFGRGGGGGNPLGGFTGRGLSGRFQGGGGGSGDSLQRRDRSEDSVTISFRFIDSLRNYYLDSSVIDFSVSFPVPPVFVNLGNLGTAARPLLFSPYMRAGWDPGFHAFDIYKWQPEDVRFFNTTKPYTLLAYLSGSRSEQIIEVQHTQNIKPNWNALFQYRMINAPGFFKNQKANHNNYLFTSWYESKNKRYNNYFIGLGNKQQSFESGGILDDKDYLNDVNFKDRFNIPTQIGGDTRFARDFFSTKISTGNRYKETGFVMRQQYDLGKRDSLVSDSTVIPLFYPRLRFEHTFQYKKSYYEFIDQEADTEYYRINYDTIYRTGDTINRLDRWKEISNDFSIYQYPDAKNLQQFIKAGATFQYLMGGFPGLKKNFYNLFVHGEYRNRTRNKKWDILASGNFYLNGLNAGDYHAFISLKSFAGKKIGYLEAGFENVNRSPSFAHDSRSAFYTLDNVVDFKKENTTHLFASYYQPRLQLRILGHYYLVSNYLWLQKFYQLEQEGTLFNVLQAGVEKVTRLRKHWNLYSDVYIQQKAGSAPVNLPLLFTRQRLAFEGLFFKTNLKIATGLEFRYHTPYKADHYSPLLGRYYYQDSFSVKNLPDISAFVHFRIRNFKTYIRAENLNTISLNQGFGFTNNNLVAEGYPMPGLQIRVGIYWTFVN